MHETDALIQGWLSRELMFSAFLHDLRGPLTALSGVVEMMGHPPMLKRINQRINTMLEATSPLGTQRFPCELGALLDMDQEAHVVLCSPPLLLKRSILGLPHQRRSLLKTDVVELCLEGVSIDDWGANTPQEPSPGLLLRMAARLSGATHVVYRSEGMVRLHFPHAPTTG